jgi:DNA-directed RNA polymerase specialized sigma24 family protein
VAGEETGPLITNDAALLDRVRTGDNAAFGLLRQRHADAARRLARDLVVSPAEVDDLVDETFARVLAALQRGEGPTDAFRCYLLGALRQVNDRRYAGRRPGRRRRPGPGPELDRAGALDRAEVTGPGSPLIVRAYFSLPQRWSALLWHTEVEQENEEEVAPLFGLSLSGLAALAGRAKEGIRQSYLDSYLGQVARPQCQPVAERLGAYLRFALSEPRSGEVAVHLTECDRCRTAYGELIDLGASLRRFVAPAVLGSVAASYLSGSGPATAAGARAEDVLVRRPAGDTAAAQGPAPAAAAGAADLDGQPDGRTGPPTLLPGLPRHWRRTAAGGAVLVVLAGAVVAITLTGHPAALASHDPRPHSAAPSLVAGSAQPTKKPEAKKARPKATPPAPTPTPTPADRTSTSAPPPAPTTAASSSPTTASSTASDVTLTASVSVFGPGRGNGAQVFFQVGDTGSAGTSSLTATISLPSGSSLAGSWSGHRHSWTCQQTSSGATCQHGPISAGQQAFGLIWIQLNGSAACGQDVQLTVSSGSVSASAQSQDIQCGSGR